MGPIRPSSGIFQKIFSWLAKDRGKTVEQGTVDQLFNDKAYYVVKPSERSLFARVFRQHPEDELSQFIDLVIEKKFSKSVTSQKIEILTKLLEQKVQQEPREERVLRLACKVAMLQLQREEYPFFGLENCFEELQKMEDSARDEVVLASSFTQLVEKREALVKEVTWPLEPTELKTIPVKNFLELTKKLFKKKDVALESEAFKELIGIAANKLKENEKEMLSFLQEVDHHVQRVLCEKKEQKDQEKVLVSIDRLGNTVASYSYFVQGVADAISGVYTAIVQGKKSSELHGKVQDYLLLNELRGIPTRNEFWDVISSRDSSKSLVRWKDMSSEKRKLDSLLDSACSIEETLSLSGKEVLKTNDKFISDRHRETIAFFLTEPFCVLFSNDDQSVKTHLSQVQKALPRLGEMTKCMHQGMFSEDQRIVMKELSKKGMGTILPRQAEFKPTFALVVKRDRVELMAFSAFLESPQGGISSKGDTEGTCIWKRYIFDKTKISEGVSLVEAMQEAKSGSFEMTYQNDQHCMDDKGFALLEKIIWLDAEGEETQALLQKLIWRKQMGRAVTLHEVLVLKDLLPEEPRLLCLEAELRNKQEWVKTILKERKELASSLVELQKENVLTMTGYELETLAAFFKKQGEVALLFEVAQLQDRAGLLCSMPLELFEKNSALASLCDAQKQKQKETLESVEKGSSDLTKWIEQDVARVYRVAQMLSEGMLVLSEEQQKGVFAALEQVLRVKPEDKTSNDAVKSWIDACLVMAEKDKSNFSEEELKNMAVFLEKNEMITSLFRVACLQAKYGLPCSMEFSLFTNKNVSIDQGKLRSLIETQRDRLRSHPRKWKMVVKKLQQGQKIEDVEIDFILASKSLSSEQKELFWAEVLKKDEAMILQVVKRVGKGNYPLTPREKRLLADVLEQRVGTEKALYLSILQAACLLAKKQNVPFYRMKRCCDLLGFVQERGHKYEGLGESAFKLLEERKTLLKELQQSQDRSPAVLVESTDALPEGLTEKQLVTFLDKVGAQLDEDPRGLELLFQEIAASYSSSFGMYSWITGHPNRMKAFIATKKSGDEEEIRLLFGAAKKNKEVLVQVLGQAIQWQRVPDCQGDKTSLEVLSLLQTVVQKAVFLVDDHDLEKLLEIAFSKETTEEKIFEEMSEVFFLMHEGVAKIFLSEGVTPEEKKRTLERLRDANPLIHDRPELIDKYSKHFNLYDSISSIYNSYLENRREIISQVLPCMSLLALMGKKIPDSFYELVKKGVDDQSWASQVKKIKDKPLEQQKVFFSMKDPTLYDDSLHLKGQMVAKDFFRDFPRNNYLLVGQTVAAKKRSSNENERASFLTSLLNEVPQEQVFAFSCLLGQSADAELSTKILEKQRWTPCMQAPISRDFIPQKTVVIDEKTIKIVYVGRILQMEEEPPKGGLYLREITFDREQLSQEGVSAAWRSTNDDYIEVDLTKQGEVSVSSRQELLKKLAEKQGKTEEEKVFLQEVISLSYGEERLGTFTPETYPKCIGQLIALLKNKTITLTGMELEKLANFLEANNQDPSFRFEVALLQDEQELFCTTDLLKLGVGTIDRQRLEALQQRQQEKREALINKEPEEIKAWVEENPNRIYQIIQASTPGKPSVTKQARSAIVSFLEEQMTRKPLKKRDIHLAWSVLQWCNTLEEASFSSKSPFIALLDQMIQEKLSLYGLDPDEVLQQRVLCSLQEIGVTGYLKENLSIETVNILLVLQEKGKVMFSVTDRLSIAASLEKLRSKAGSGYRSLQCAFTLAKLHKQEGLPPFLGLKGCIAALEKVPRRRTTKTGDQLTFEQLQIDVKEFDSLKMEDEKLTKQWQALSEKEVEQRCLETSTNIQVFMELGISLPTSLDLLKCLEQAKRGETEALSKFFNKTVLKEFQDKEEVDKAISDLFDLIEALSIILLDPKENKIDKMQLLDTVRIACGDGMGFEMKHYLFKVLLGFREAFSLLIDNNEAFHSKLLFCIEQTLVLSPNRVGLLKNLEGLAKGVQVSSNVKSTEEIVKGNDKQQRIDLLLQDKSLESKGKMLIGQKQYEVSSQFLKDICRDKTLFCNREGVRSCRGGEKATSFYGDLFNEVVSVFPENVKNQRIYELSRFFVQAQGSLNCMMNQYKAYSEEYFKLQLDSDSYYSDNLPIESPRIVVSIRENELVVTSILYSGFVIENNKNVLVSIKKETFSIDDLRKGKGFEEAVKDIAVESLPMEYEKNSFGKLVLTEQSQKELADKFLSITFDVSKQESIERELIELSLGGKEFIRKFIVVMNSDKFSSQDKEAFLSEWLKMVDDVSLLKALEGLSLKATSLSRKSQEMLGDALEERFKRATETKEVILQAAVTLARLQRVPFYRLKTCRQALQESQQKTGWQQKAHSLQQVRKEMIKGRAQQLRETTSGYDLPIEFIDALEEFQRQEGFSPETFIKGFETFLKEEPAYSLEKLLLEILHEVVVSKDTTEREIWLKQIESLVCIWQEKILSILVDPNKSGEEKEEVVKQFKELINLKGVSFSDNNMRSLLENYLAKFDRFASLCELVLSGKEQQVNIASFLSGIISVYEEMNKPVPDELFALAALKEPSYVELKDLTPDQRKVYLLTHDPSMRRFEPVEMSSGETIEVSSGFQQGFQRASWVFWGEEILSVNETSNPEEKKQFLQKLLEKIPEAQRANFTCLLEEGSSDAAISDQIEHTLLRRHLIQQNVSVSSCPLTMQPGKYIVVRDNALFLVRLVGKTTIDGWSGTLSSEGICRIQTMEFALDKLKDGLEKALQKIHEQELPVTVAQDRIVDVMLHDPIAEVVFATMKVNDVSLLNQLQPRGKEAEITLKACLLRSKKSFRDSTRLTPAAKDLVELVEKLLEYGVFSLEGDQLSTLLEIAVAKEVDPEKILEEVQTVFGLLCESATTLLLDEKVPVREKQKVLEALESLKEFVSSKQSLLFFEEIFQIVQTPFSQYLLNETEKSSASLQEDLIPCLCICNALKMKNKDWLFRLFARHPKASTLQRDLQTLQTFPLEMQVALLVLMDQHDTRTIQYGGKSYQIMKQFTDDLPRDSWLVDGDEFALKGPQGDFKAEEVQNFLGNLINSFSEKVFFDVAVLVSQVTLNALFGQYYSKEFEQEKLCKNYPEESFFRVFYPKPNKLLFKENKTLIFSEVFVVNQILDKEGSVVRKGKSIVLTKKFDLSKAQVGLVAAVISCEKEEIEEEESEINQMTSEKALDAILQHTSKDTSEKEVLKVIIALKYEKKVPQDKLQTAKDIVGNKLKEDPTSKKYLEYLKYLSVS